jgi:hypothetical protein
VRSTWRGAPAALLVVLALVGTMVSGCSDDGDSLLDSDRPVSLTDEQHVLDQRAAALRDGDLKAFLTTIDISDPKLVKRQRRYFANVQELPVEALSYDVLKSDWPAGLRSPHWGRQVSVPQVRISLQLRGFDTVPVQRVTGFAFGYRKGRAVVVSELTGAGKQFPGSNPAPWDLVRVHVRSDLDSLQLYDSGTWSRADEVASELRSAITDIRDSVPGDWDGHTVVYVFSRPAVLNSFEGVPGGNIKHLGAMTFPMYAVPGQPAVAGIRFTLLPTSLHAGRVFLGRIIRHELTHVALGDRDDGAPVWFAEGVAEYMGARGVPQDERRIATVALSRARAGVDQMPASRGFNGADQAWHYALSWMACDYIAAAQGEARLWQLMDALHNGGRGTSDAAQDAVLRTVIGLDSTQLAHRAAARILRIYG